MATSRRKRGAQPQAPAPPAPQPPTAAAPAPAAVPGVVNRRTELKQTWSEPVRVGENPAEPAELPGEPLEYELPTDPVAAFLETLDYDQGYTLRVDLLTNWEQDGKSGVKAPKRFCRQYQFDVENYLNLIAEEFGGGAYWLTLRRVSDGQVVKFWVEHVAARKQPPQPPAWFPQQAGSPPAPADALGPTLQTIKQIGAFARELGGIRSAFGWDNNPPEYMPPPPPPPPAAAESLQDKLLGLMITRAAEKGDDDKLERILSALLGREEKAERGFDFIGTLERIAGPLLEQFGPTLAQAWLSSRAGAPGAPAQPPPGAVTVAAAPAPGAYRTWPAPPGGPEPMPIGPLPTIAPQTPMAGSPIAAAPSPIGPLAGPIETEEDSQETGVSDEMQDNMDRLLDALVQALAGTSKAGLVDMLLVERGAGWIRSFEQAFPAASLFITGLVYGTPEQVLQTLETYHSDFAGVSKLPLARDFVVALQNTLKGVQQ